MAEEQGDSPSCQLSAIARKEHVIPHPTLVELTHDVPCSPPGLAHWPPVSVLCYHQLILCSLDLALCWRDHPLHALQLALPHSRAQGGMPYETLEVRLLEMLPISLYVPVQI